jgi:hypothetical protein
VEAFACGRLGPADVLQFNRLVDRARLHRERRAVGPARRTHRIYVARFEQSAGACASGREE